MSEKTLDFRGFGTGGDDSRADIHTYIAEQMDFPAYYGKNLDALYDCLTDIGSPVSVTLLLPDEERITPFLRRIRAVFRDAERDNPRLAVFEKTGG